MCDLIEKISINYELFNNITESIKYCKNVMNYNITSNFVSISVKMSKRIAELNIAINQKIIASDNYLECAKFAHSNSLLKYSVKNYLLYSLIM